jgi:hypothetical protein
MAMVLLCSNCLISFNKLSQFLNESSINLKGFLDVKDLEFKYCNPVVSETDFLLKIKNLEGFTVIGEFDHRELSISLFESKKAGFEVMIFLDSLDHSQREPIKVILQNTFNTSNLFRIIVFDNDDDSNNYDWSAELDGIMMRIPESVSSFSIKR